MGVMTLTNFRDDTQSALGDRGLGNTSLDRWINQAYLDIAGAVEFDILQEEDTAQSTVNGTVSVNVPTGAHKVKYVRNTTGDTLLEWVPVTELYRRSQTSGTPIVWTQRKNLILFNPIPNAVLALRIGYRKSPTVLSAVGDVTVLPDYWDAPIFILAVHYGLLSRGEDQRAMVWLQRAAAYIQSRITEKDLMEDRGLNWTLPLIQNQLIAAAGAAK